MDTRIAAVAGQFYPAEPTALRTQVSEFLRAAKAQLPPTFAAPKALIAPHAGTVYSGPIAASAYARWMPARDRITRVVLLGPAHRVWFEGVGLSRASHFATPLGDVPVDLAAVAELRGMDGVVDNDEAHRLEHSLEVHLPFLQETLGAFSLVPLVIGDADPALVARVLEHLWGSDETGVVISSDLSHFHDYDTAGALDRETSRMIEALELERLTGDRACGYQPIRGLLHLARQRSLTVSAVDLRNSGDTAGTRDRVVGYGSYVVA